MASSGPTDAVAYVVVTPRGGVPAEPPSSRNLAAWAPDAADLARARAEFEALGFRVGPASGGTFSIAGPAAAFEAGFGVRVRLTEKGFTAAHAGSAGATLPLDKLPPALRRLIHSAAFPEAPDFGPGHCA